MSWVQSLLCISLKQNFYHFNIFFFHFSLKNWITVTNASCAGRNIFPQSKCKAKNICVFSSSSSMSVFCSMNERAKKYQPLAVIIDKQASINCLDCKQQQTEKLNSYSYNLFFPRMVWGKTLPSISSARFAEDFFFFFSPEVDRQSPYILLGNTRFSFDL